MTTEPWRAIGVFITLEDPSRDMLTEATTAGFYHSPSWDKGYPALLALTIADLMHGHAGVQMPLEYDTNFVWQRKVRRGVSAICPDGWAWLAAAAPTSRNAFESRARYR